MVIYQCDQCLMKFTLKSEYQKHLKRKTPCSIIKSAIYNRPTSFECKCGSVFSRKDNLRRHLLTFLCETKYNKKTTKITTEQITTKNITIESENIIYQNKHRRPRRQVPTSLKKTIVANQHFRCANKSGNLPGLEGYQCHLWRIEGVNKGIFDESWFEIDHIVEHSLTADDSEKNLQALCSMCHKVKTGRFMSNRKKKKNFLSKNNYHDDNDDCKSDELEDYCDNNEKKINQLTLQKEIAYCLLKQINKQVNNNEYILLFDTIEQVSNINILNFIILLLTKSFYLGDDISIDIIKEKIKKEAEIDKFIFGRSNKG